MAKLYYGNGECSISSSKDITGLEIRYKGKASIVGFDNASRITMSRNNMILIISLNRTGLKELFTYTGTFRIISVLVSDMFAEIVPTTIHKVMDVVELLNSNAEDMTEIKVEDMDASYTYNKIPTTKNIDLVINQHTSTHDGNLYLDDGTKYYGDYHVHLEDGGAMTGNIHTKQSLPLYYKRVINGLEMADLIPTKRIPGYKIPQYNDPNKVVIRRHRKKRKRRKIRISKRKPT